MSELDLTVEARARVPMIEPPGDLSPAVIATWRGRMINEHGSSYVFEQLAVQLAAIGLHDEADQVERFAAEEREHGALCGAVVEAAGGEARATALPIRELPAHADTTARAGMLRNVISICCLSETVAVSLIGAERLEMPPGPLRELLTKIWSDEVGHARFGWRLLARLYPELTADEISAITRYLPIAFGHLEAHELAHLPLNEWPDRGTAYGLCGGADARTLFFETVDEVIVPQLAALGLPADQAWNEKDRMTPEIRRAAVRAAAKAALITAIGCSGDPKPSTTPSNVSTAAKPEAKIDCTAFLGGLEKVKQDALADDDPVKKRNDVYGQVFAKRAERESAETQKCCDAELATAGASSKFRWECCSALPQGKGAACTPWGPPCPPAMPA